ncbi:inner nuclear membrane protein Man1-like [Arapaima gigas]
MAAAQLTDEEIFVELKRLGFAPGPVTESTRPVYLKKLKKLREEQQQQQQRRSRPGKARYSSGSLNSTSSGHTAAGASAFGTRPTGDDVTHSERCNSGASGAPPGPRASAGTGRVVLGFSSDESDVEVNLGKEQNHSGRRDRDSGHRPHVLQLRSGPGEAPYVGRGGTAGGPGSFCAPRLPDGRRSGSAARWWDERVTAAAGRPEEGARRADWGLGRSASPRRDYSDSDEEAVVSPLDRYRSPRLALRRSLPKTAPFSSEDQDGTGVGVLGDRDSVTGGSGHTAAGPVRREDGLLGPRETLLSDGLWNRSCPTKSDFSSRAVDVRVGGSGSSSAYSNNHVRSEDPGARRRYSVYNSLSTGYRCGDSGSKRKLAAPEEELLQQFRREEVSATSGFSAHYLSMVLLTAACLFFILLGLMYLRMRGSGAPEGHAVVKSHPFGTDFDTALNEKDKNTILKVLLHLHDHLAKIAGEHDCGDYSQHSNRSLSLNEVSEFLMLRGADYVHSLGTALQWIIKTGEDVGISRLINNGSEKSVTEVSHVTHLESTHPKMSFICRFRRALFTVIHRVLLVLAGVGVVWGVLYYMKYRWRKEEVETRQMYDMVERIIDVLRSHSEACQESPDLKPYLPIPHVRDSLIQPQDRKRMKKVWDLAVAFLSANESRIRTETQRIGGADFLVWRWIQPNITCDKMSNMPSKVWQGKAFPLDRRNSPPNSLTPCLKIRNMFDPVMEVGDNWDLTIHEAILEKCSDNDGIVHIAVDKNSREGCVYMKCLTAEHAGKAFKALHGSWFDGKLVTVKYLRLDRYHQRFPQALDCSIPLKPSGKHMSTLSHLQLHASTDGHAGFS